MFSLQQNKSLFSSVLCSGLYDVLILFGLCVYASLLVLDEMDQLDSKAQDVLYTIFEWPYLPKSRLCLIGELNIVWSLYVGIRNTFVCNIIYIYLLLYNIQ